MRALRPAALTVVAGVVVVLVFGQQYVGSVFVLALCYGIVTAGMAVQIGFSQQIEQLLLRAELEKNHVQDLADALVLDLK